jgi:peptide/nickel transport system substrate-binding protein
MANYWDNVLRSRVSRRRAIVGTGALTASAAFLAACGGDDDDDGGSTGSVSSSGGSSGSSSGSGSSGAQTNPLVYTIVDETADAIKGGVYKGSHPGVILTHDPMKTGINIRGARRGFSQLFRVADGVLTGADGTIEGDLATSWEMSPDNLTLTVKLEPQAGFAPVPPVNGRKVDAEDVVFTWNRFLTEGIQRADYANSLNPSAPITGMEAPDAQTVVIKLAAPNATLFSLLGTEVLGSMYILAKEGADSSVLDIARKPIGTGPYYLTEDSEIKYVWTKNPNFYRAKITNGAPFIDTIEEPVIPEQATAVAQLRAGGIFEYNVPATDVVGTKKDISQLLMRQTFPVITGTERIYFGVADGSPFKDERVRIAYMKTIDRDAFIIAAHNVDRFEDDGLPVNTYWDATLARGVYEGWWLDPQGSDFGENAKNYEYSLEDAKALVEAAGFSTPLEFTESYAAPGPSAFPQSFYNRADIFLGQVEGSGVFKMNRNLINYQTEYNTERYRFSKGNFVGASWGPDTASSDPTIAAFFLLNSGGGYSFGQDAELDELTNKARMEFDDDARKQLIFDVQRRNAAIFLNNKIGQATGFALNWPALRNVAVHRGGSNWMDISTASGGMAFIDPSRPPLA